MKIGFSLSPGGLLLPYHLGALASLAYHGYVNEGTPLAGSSAGAIAVAAEASGVPSLTALDASIRVSSKLRGNPLFVPSGGLLPALRTELQRLLPAEAHLTIKDREGIVGLAYRELFPQNKAILKTNFETRKCLLDAICDSSTFPYFLTNRPVRMVRRHQRILPRMVVDGVFACDFERIGCPKFEQLEQQTTTNANAASTSTTTKKVTPDRTVMISVFPTEFLSLTTTPKEDQIGPLLEENNMVGQAIRLVRMATTGSKPSECKDLYQEGFMDVEHWTRREERRARKKHKERTRDMRLEA